MTSKSLILIAHGSEPTPQMIEILNRHRDKIFVVQNFNPAIPDKIRECMNYRGKFDNVVLLAHGLDDGRYITSPRTAEDYRQLIAGINENLGEGKPVSFHISTCHAGTVLKKPDLQTHLASGQSVFLHGGDDEIIDHQGFSKHFEDILTKPTDFSFTTEDDFLDSYPTGFSAIYKSAKSDKMKVYNYQPQLADIKGQEGKTKLDKFRTYYQKKEDELKKFVKNNFRKLTSRSTVESDQRLSDEELTTVLNDVASMQSNQRYQEWHDYFSPLISVDHPTSDGITAIELALSSRINQSSKLDFLLGQKLDIGIKNKHQQNLLNAIVGKTSSEIFLTILKNSGASKEKFTHVINEPDAQGLNLFLGAVMANKPDIVKYLIGSGADMNFRHGSGASALLLAINNLKGKDSVKMVNLLLDNGFDLHKKHEGKSTYDIITEKGNLIGKKILDLVENKAKPKAVIFKKEDHDLLDLDGINLMMDKFSSPERLNQQREQRGLLGGGRQTQSAQIGQKGNKQSDNLAYNFASTVILGLLSAVVGLRWLMRGNRNAKTTQAKISSGGETEIDSVDQKKEVLQEVELPLDNSANLDDIALSPSKNISPRPESPTIQTEKLDPKTVQPTKDF